MRFRPKRKTQFFLPTYKQQGRINYKEVLEVTMKHGDMMVMVGTDIQKVYEVSFTVPIFGFNVPNKISTPLILTACAVSRSQPATSIPNG
jgi:hypothetical protein